MTALTIWTRTIVATGEGPSFKMQTVDDVFNVDGNAPLEMIARMVAERSGMEGKKTVGFHLIQEGAQEGAKWLHYQ